MRFTKVVFIYLRLLMSLLHLKEKVDIHLQTKLHNYQLKQAINIPLNARSWNDLKGLADSLKKWGFRRHTDMSNSLSHPYQNWTSTLSKKHKSMEGLFNQSYFIGIPPISRTSTCLGQFGSLRYYCCSQKT